MIVRPEEDGLVLIRQAQHAQHAGELAVRLADPPPGPVGAFVAAARLHDNGWRQYDAEPLLDPETGLPYSYRHMPPEEYRAIWRRGIGQAAAVDDHLGLLVSLHGMQFFERRKGPEDQAFLREERAREDALIAHLGLEGTWEGLPPSLKAEYEWLRFIDGLSLFALDRWEGPWTAEVLEIEVSVWWDGDVVRVDPWPFEEPLTLVAPGVELPEPSYADRSTFLTDYRAAPRVEVATRYVPGDPAWEDERERKLEAPQTRSRGPWWTSSRSSRSS